MKGGRTEVKKGLAFVYGQVYVDWTRKLDSGVVKARLDWTSRRKRGIYSMDLHRKLGSSPLQKNCDA